MGTGVKTTIRELAEMVLDITGSPLAVDYQPGGLTFVRNRVGCPEKAAAELGYRYRVGLREGLEQLIAWRTAHRDQVEARRRAAGGAES